MAESSDRLVPIVSLLIAALAVGVAVSTVVRSKLNGADSAQPASTTTQNSFNVGSQTSVAQPAPNGASNSNNASSHASSRVLNHADASLSGGSYQLVAGGECRRVLYDGLAVYTEPNPNSSVVRQNLYAGQQVGLLNATPSLGPDGENYVQVSVPYGATDAPIGFMRSQTRLNNGAQVSTLALCEVSPSPSPSPSPGIPARW